MHRFVSHVVKLGRRKQVVPVILPAHLPGTFLGNQGGDEVDWNRVRGISFSNLVFCRWWSAFSFPLLSSLSAALTCKGRAKASSCIVNESPSVAFRSVSLISRRENCFPCYGRGRLRNQMSRDACRNQRTARNWNWSFPSFPFFLNLVNFSRPVSLRIKRNLIFSAYQLTSINASFASQRRETIAEILRLAAKSRKLRNVGKKTGLNPIYRKISGRL